MAFMIIEVADRATLATDPDADFQNWRGIAADSNRLRFSRMRSGQRRSWCSIDRASDFVRLTQGLSFNGHFPNPGEVLIYTNQSPGQSFALTFDHPVTGVGLDVEPDPAVVLPGQTYKVRLELFGQVAGDTFVLEKVGNVGASRFIGGRSDSNQIVRMNVQASLLDAAGNAAPVDFAVNRLELLVPVGLIA
jgi:hypothetical protein